jgi:hypothetical protein
MVPTTKVGDTLFFDDRDGPMMYRVEFRNRVGNVSGVEYFATLREIEQYTTYLGLTAHYRIETPEMYLERVKN